MTAAARVFGGADVEMVLLVTAGGATAYSGDEYGVRVQRPRPGRRQQNRHRCSPRECGQSAAKAAWFCEAHHGHERDRHDREKDTVVDARDRLQKQE